MSKETQLIAENMVERLNLRQWPLVYTANVIYAIPPNHGTRYTTKRSLLRTGQKERIK